ncbi:MAG: tRNA preQ1(34) S-adenosylmethionine ribosyltransferase-isomerase QueA [Anaerolineales bacterium]|jgi:S-adenosylmethionine:tRNA ribosyltransferase-isomerase|nr:tRNA preQ1(34) S-adenosylmethionine ribosyltransferase-isomerase QueA [Anaerolineales bacterium]HJO33600.1 tRNA preQ1(34) S-adenosylmethionine ribosyltransferase-isomerase QueA [Anaerolineales bacterium]
MGENNSLRTDDFDFHLPPEFIAQTPAKPRDAARLLVLRRGKRRIAHRHVTDLVSYLRSGDVLVLNDTRVLPARLQGRKESGGKAELLLLKRISARTWEVLVGGCGLKVDARVVIGDGTPIATVLEETSGPRRLVRFSCAITPLLNGIGEMPLPPYIRSKINDDERYQTVYAAEPGSIAAPTAGLHFTSGLLAEIRAMGVNVPCVTLHVGLDTFAPVQTEMIDDHPIHREWCCLDEAAAEIINRARRGGGRIVAVGTTTARVLETAARSASCDRVAPVCGETDLFITPGYRFSAVDALLTNFHLPRSTLLMMVAAFCGAGGRASILDAYKHAMLAGYRFYSFGDAMLIL